MNDMEVKQATATALADENDFLRERLALLENNEQSLLNDIRELREELSWKGLTAVPDAPAANKLLKQELIKDSYYAWAWQCNLAMSHYDTGCTHKVANLAAANFMHVAWDIDITKNANWTDFTIRWAEEGQ